MDLHLDRALLSKEAGLPIIINRDLSLLDEIKRRVTELIVIQMHCLQDELVPELARNGLFLLKYQDLSEKEKRLRTNILTTRSTRDLHRRRSIRRIRSRTFRAAA